MRARVLPKAGLIPIRDINPRHRLPYVNYGLILACAGAFLFQLSLGDDVDALTRAFGFVPARLSDAFEAHDSRLIVAAMQSALTSMFLHGGWIHVIGNLVYLRVFGDNVEDRFGHLSFFVFYCASGVMGAFGQYAADPHSTTPVIGASGAIAGVLGAYIVLFPRARILTLFPIFIFLTFVEVPAVVFLGLWAAQQFLNGMLSISTSFKSATAGGGVAWFAHIGGFALGVICGGFGRILRRDERVLS